MEPTSAPPRRWSPPAPRRLAGLLGLATFVIIADQVTKALVRVGLHPGETWPAGWELIRFSHVHNYGAAFGILQGASTFLVIAPLIAIAAITVFLLTLPSQSKWYSVGLAAILGGAIGNLIDRVRLGYVTDFIDPTHYPSFNIADSAIVLGVALVAILAFFAPSEESTTTEEQRTGHPDQTERSERSEEART